MCLIRKVSDILDSLMWCMKSCDLLHWNISSYVVIINMWGSIQSVQREHLEENVKCFVSATNSNRIKKWKLLKYLITSYLLIKVYLKFIKIQLHLSVRTIVLLLHGYCIPIIRALCIIILLDCFYYKLYLCLTCTSVTIYNL